MAAVYISVAAVILVITAVFVLRRYGRTVVDNFVIWVSHDTHRTSIVYYRDGRRTIRFGAEVCAPQDGGAFLYVRVPDTMYADDGHIIPNDESAAIKQRLSRGLKQLGIAHEFSWPETASGQLPIR